MGPSIAVEGYLYTCTIAKRIFILFVVYIGDLLDG